MVEGEEEAAALRPRKVRTPQGRLLVDVSLPKTRAGDGWKVPQKIDHPALN